MWLVAILLICFISKWFYTRRFSNMFQFIDKEIWSRTKTRAHKIEQILNHIALNTCTINLQQNDNNHTQRSSKHTNSKPVLSNIGHATMVDFGLSLMLNIGQHGGFFCCNLLLCSHKMADMVGFWHCSTHPPNNPLPFLSPISLQFSSSSIMKNTQTISQTLEMPK
jgi:hypothetical protein